MKKMIWLALCAVLASFPIVCSCSSIGINSNAGHSDFMRLNDIEYLAISQPTPLLAAQYDLSVYDTVKRKTKSGAYRNGDAEGLEPGTPVYALSVYAPGFRLAVKRGPDWWSTR